MDYYKILEVSKKASPDEIKKAHRRLALEYHPDRNPDKEGADDKLKEINQAYTVLKDPQKRASYDRFGPSGQHRAGPSSGIPFDMEEMLRNMGMGQRSRASQPMQGGHVLHEIRVSLSAALLGSKYELELTLMDNCADCSGAGFTKSDDCLACEGRGMIQARVNQNMISSHQCRACNGMGKVATNNCDNCRGKGSYPASRAFSVNIPEGTKHGTELRLKGKGQNGRNGGPPGHLILRVFVDYPTELSEEQREFFRDLDGKKEEE